MAPFSEGNPTSMTGPQFHVKNGRTTQKGGKYNGTHTSE